MTELYIFLNKLKKKINDLDDINNIFKNNEKVSFPFKNIYDSKNRITNIISITACFRSDEHRKIYEKLKKEGYIFFGCCSYLEFPGKIIHPYDDKYHVKNKDNYIKMCKAWCHCFKEPKKIFPDSTPLALISESDFVNLNKLKSAKKNKKKYDFIYICLDGNMKWQEYIHRWHFAIRAIEIMCNKYNLKGLLVGRKNSSRLPNIKNKDLLEMTELLKKEDFIKKMKQCKFLFECAGSSASPRVITESMALDLPVLLNKNIIGGWKYINNKTGETFVNINDFEEKLNLLLNNYNNYEPRKYLENNFGIEKSGKKLLKFLKNNYPELNTNEVNFLRF
jgi:hypothetical protein